MKDLENTKKRMNDPNFLSKAPADVVEATNKRLEEVSFKVDRLKVLISEIEELLK